MLRNTFPKPPRGILHYVCMLSKFCCMLINLLHSWIKAEVNKIVSKVNLKFKEDEKASLIHESFGAIKYCNDALKNTVMMP